MPLDEWAGLDRGQTTPQAKCLLCLAAASWSFDVAAQRLWEMCLIRVSNDTVRRVAAQEGKAAGQWLESSPAAGTQFQKAEGHVEFYSDGTKFNTTAGWREIRLSIFAKREAGEPATPEQWKDRVLPSPAARVALAAVAACEEQGRLWKKLSALLGIADDDELSVLADGARWIWDQARQCWIKAQWVVDVFHVSEHVHACGKALFASQEPQARDWSDQQLLELIRHGAPNRLAAWRQLLEQQAPGPAREALEGLIGYVRENQDSLWYAQRLAAGLPIGSGLIEGGCKTIIGNRLKLNSARWTVPHAQAIATLRCLQYNGLWDTYWERPRLTAA